MLPTRLVSVALLPVWLGFAAGSSAPAQQIRYSPVNRQAEHVLPQTVPAAAATLRAGLASRTAVSLAVADFDADGTRDLVTGYATATGGALLLQRGSPLALSPAPENWPAIARGVPVVPFAEKAESLSLPVRPDLMKSADLSGFGHADLVVARKGDTAVYVLRGDGQGSFATPQPFPVEGAVTALTVWRSAAAENLIVAGVCGPAGCGLRFLSGEGTLRGFIATPGVPDLLELASLNGGGLVDLAVIAKGSLMLVDGDSALSGTPAVETLPVSNPVGMAPGHFVYDRRGYRQLAVLDANGTLHVMARAGIDSTRQTRAEAAVARSQKHSAAAALSRVRLNGKPWTEAETLPGVGAGDGGTPLMVRGRFNGGGYDDLAILSGTRYVLVTHPTHYAGGVGTTTPEVTIDSMAQTVTAAAGARLAADARMGLITAGDAHVAYLELPANRTMIVNTTADATPNSTSENDCINGTSGCTLRAAIAVANRDNATNGSSKADTIDIPAGTYSLSTTNNGSTYDSQADYNYHFAIDASVNLIGAGVGQTILNGNNLDQVFNFNSGVVGGNSSNYFYDPSTDDDYLAGMTIENGENRNNPASSQCSADATGTAAPFCLFGGGAIYDSFTGPGNLTLNGVAVANSSAVYGGSDANSEGDALGGGVYVGSNDEASSEIVSSLLIENSTFSSNTAGSSGGAVYNYGACVQYSLTNDTFTSNTAGRSNSASSEDPYAAGGAFYMNGNAVCSGEAADTLTTITAAGNKATDQGGAIYIEGPVTASGLTLSGNTGGSFGGGLMVAPGNAAISVTTSTFTSNTLIGNSGETYEGGGGNANGAGMCFDSGTSGNTLALHYSRFHGNTISSSRSGLGATGLGVSCVGAANQQASVNATDNWWGCNPTTSSGQIAGSGCDTALTSSSSSEPLTVAPYTRLTLAVSPASPAYNASVTATASLGQDSAGTIYSTGNDAAYLATPITAFTLTDTSGVTYSPSATAFSSTAATATSFAAATATGTADQTGSGTASLTVDGQSLSTTFTITAPDLTVSSTHPGNFKAGDTADTYTLTAFNTGTASTRSTVTVVDALPSGFAATALSGSGWTCTLSSLTCTRSDALSASVSYPPIALTVSVSGSDAGTYTNMVTVSGGGEANTSNDTGSDPTTVVGEPTIVEAFSPVTIAPGATSTLTFTVGNPGADTVSLTGVAFSDTLPSGLTVSNPSGATTNCPGGTVSAGAGGSAVSLAGATLAAGATCTVSVSVSPAGAGSYTNTSGAVSSTNGGTGGTATAMLKVVQATNNQSFSSSTGYTVAEGASLGIDIVFSYPGDAPVPTPTGAISITVDGSTAGLSGQTCTFKNKNTSESAHTNCSVTYTAPMTTGTHTLDYSQAADANYTASSGTATITVTQ